MQNCSDTDSGWYNNRKNKKNYWNNKNQGEINSQDYFKKRFKKEHNENNDLSSQLSQTDIMGAMNSNEGSFSNRSERIDYSSQNADVHMSSNETEIADDYQTEYGIETDSSQLTEFEWSQISVDITSKRNLFSSNYKNNNFMSENSQPDNENQPKPEQRRAS